MNQARALVESFTAPGGPAASGVSLDQKTRAAIENLRGYLRMLQAWHLTLEAGLWVAALAGSATRGDGPDRLLQGLPPSRRCSPSPTKRRRRS